MSSTLLPISTRTRTTGSAALPKYAAVVVGFMVLVILEGAVVRATGSGAGCGNHWPLCNGDFFPHHPRLATVIEYTHRSMTGIIISLVGILIGWTFLARPRGDRARRAVVWCGILLITEALLGALLVKGGYVESNASNMRVVMQCIHFTNTMLLLAAITLTWWWLRDRPQPSADLGPSARTVAWISLVATLFVGAHRLRGCTCRHALSTHLPASRLPAGLRRPLTPAGSHALAAPRDRHHRLGLRHLDCPADPKQAWPAGRRPGGPATPARRS